MSSYIDHRNAPSFIPGRATDFSVTVDWRAMADHRLAFLYGADHRVQRAAMTAADLDAWKRLGTPRRPAA